MTIERWVIVGLAIMGVAALTGLVWLAVLIVDALRR
jgi:hypothetical protein